MRLRYYPGRYAQVKRYRRRKPSIRVYRYDAIDGKTVYTAKPKLRNGPGMNGCFCFALTLGEARLNRECFEPSARMLYQTRSGVWEARFMEGPGNAHTDC